MDSKEKKGAIDMIFFQFYDKTKGAGAWWLKIEAGKEFKELLA